MDRIFLTSHRRRSRRNGFTLIELLTVIAVMVTLLVISGATINLVDSWRMGQALEIARDQMNYAREIAMTNNRRVEIRIYEMEDEFHVLGWRAIDVGIEEFLPTSEEKEVKSYFRRMDKLSVLPEGCIFHPSPEYSTLLTDWPGIYTGTETENTPNGKPRRFASFVFLPDGRCALGVENSWTLTIVQQSKVHKDGQLPANFITLELDPRTARPRIYRP